MVSHTEWPSPALKNSLPIVLRPVAGTIVKSSYFFSVRTVVLKLGCATESTGELYKILPPSLHPLENPGLKSQNSVLRIIWGFSNLITLLMPESPGCYQSPSKLCLYPQRQSTHHLLRQSGFTVESFVLNWIDILPPVTSITVLVFFIP